MKLSKIILEGPLEYDPGFSRQIDKLQDQGGKHIGSGDYGSVFLLNGKAVKVTTDEVEIEHAIILKGKKTNNFVFIYDVQVIEKKLAIIEMEVLGEFKGEIPEDFIVATEKEASRLGIDPSELDFIGDNVMIHPKSSKLKMIDV
jgi:hypothetical protein|tara:strand:+ start:3594 stop:4025 length:432 start_codon:yes stop_codon:yes gene_type:complete